MTAALEQVTNYLDCRGWKYQVEQEQSYIITGVVAEHVEQLLLVIHVKDDGELLSLIAPQLLVIKDHVHKGVLLQTLLAIAWDVKLLRWEYDPTDGEVRASINLILEDNPLTERQFNRSLEALIQCVDAVAMPRLQMVLATGTDPGLQDMEALMSQLQFPDAEHQG